MASTIDPAGTPTLTEPIQDHDHASGPVDAPVEVVEYGDFECPYTRRAHAAIERVRREMGDEFRFAWRQLPLRDIHPHAQELAEASEAAAAQGKFWEMRETLWRSFGNFERSDLARFADELGLDVGRFIGDLDKHRWADRVEHDVQTATASNVPGTPTFFVAGVRYEGEAQDPAFLQRRIRQAGQRAEPT